MKFAKATLTLLLISAAIFGDYVVFNSKYSSSQVFRALSDTCVHGLIGFLSSIVFFSYDHGLSIEAYISNIIFCTVVSSLIDVDHIIAARSLQWKDITNTRHRGIFHSTSFWLLLTSVLSTFSYIKKKLNIYLLCFMLLTASLSHHLRDGNRRGLWFPPFGSTPPLNRFVYILSVAVCPHILAGVYSNTRGSFYKTVVVNKRFIV